jgi:branched-subunit amino acid permease
MMNPKTNLGGALSVTGTALIGAGVLPQIGGYQSAALWWLALTGFVLSAVGKGVTAFFAADSTTVNHIAQAVDKINQQGSDPDSAPTSNPQK